MNFQQTRQYYETPVIDTCTAQSIEYRAENTLLPTGDAVTRFCLARLQFGSMAEPAVGCRPFANERAVFVVEYFGPKGIGPAEAQTFMENVICGIGELNGVVSVNGPDFTALDDRPYFFARTSFGIQVPRNFPIDPDVALMLRLESLERTHDINGGHNSGTYDTEFSADIRALPDNFEERLARLETHHDASGGHNSGLFTRSTVNTPAQRTLTFAERLTRLEEEHDNDDWNARGHNSGEYDS